MEEVIYGFCKACGEEGFLKTTHFVFSIKCKCCDSGEHTEEVSHCEHCLPEVPEYISYESLTGVKMNNIESALILYINGN
tara:strand:- start:11 stop:250 length:240 start_codon:yes stop_codon:yes gene_type:complete